jgi:hypothetical protein
VFVVIDLSCSTLFPFITHLPLFSVAASVVQSGASDTGVVVGAGDGGSASVVATTTTAADGAQEKTRDMETEHGSASAPMVSDMC